MTFLIVLFCIILSGFLSAAEIAFVTARRSQIRMLAKSGSSRARLLKRLRENPERTLSVIQLGESFISAIAAAVGFIGTAKYLSPWLVEHLSMNPFVAQLFSVAVVVVGFTYADVVFGELVPKVLALRHPLWVATWTSHVLWLLEVSLRPLVNFLEWSTRTFVHAFFRVKSWRLHKEDDAEFDLEALPDPHRHLVLNAVALERRRIQEIYLPWKDVIWIDWNTCFEEVAKVIASSNHTRIPVLRDGKLEGILSSRDFMAALVAGEKTWQSLVRRVARIQQNATLFQALKTLQGRKNQMAVVYEGPQILGIVTMQDIFEQIVGDIYDEDDAGSLKQILSQNDGVQRIQNLDQQIRAADP